jgi:hypothetical protein
MKTEEICGIIMNNTRQQMHNILYNNQKIVPKDVNDSYFEICGKVNGAIHSSLLYNAIDDIFGDD